VLECAIQSDCSPDHSASCVCGQCVGHLESERVLASLYIDARSLRDTPRSYSVALLAGRTADGSPGGCESAGSPAANTYYTPEESPLASSGDLIVIGSWVPTGIRVSVLVTFYRGGLVGSACADGVRVYEDGARVGMTAG